MSKWNFTLDTVTQSYSDTPRNSFEMYDFLCGLKQLSDTILANVIVTCGKKNSTIEDAWLASIKGKELFYSNRNETHKPIQVSTGATTLKNTYQTKWIRK